jgi:hypothetical protein
VRNAGYEAELTTLRGTCQPGDVAYCRGIQEPLEQRREAELARLTSQQEAARIGG